MKWHSGTNEEFIWLQCMHSENDQPLITFIRPHHIQNVEIRVHNLSAHMEICREVPCYANFSLESEKDDSVIAIDGTGFITHDEHGSPTFTTGEGSYDADLSIFRTVIDMIDDDFSIWVDDNQFLVSIDSKSLSTLKSIYS